MTRSEIHSGIDRQLLDTCGLVALFLYIYSPSLYAFPINISYIFIFFAGLYLAYRTNLSKFTALFKNKVFFTYLLFYFFSLVYVLVVLGISEHPFHSMFLVTYVRLLVDILLVLPFFILLFCNDLNYSKDDFLNLLIKIGVIQGAAATMMFIIPGLRDFVFSFIMEPPSEKLLREPYRGFGITNDFYFASPLFQSLVFVVNSVFYIKTGKRRYLLFYPFILVSMVMNARVSIAVIPVFFGILFLMGFYYNDLRWLRKFSGILLIFILLILSIFLYFVFYPDKIRVVLWIMEGVFGSVGALMGDVTESKTFTTMALGHIHLPDRPFNLLFGEGLVIFGNPQSPVHSDLGYIRYIYYGGLMLSLLFYFSIVNFVLTCVLRCQDPLYKVLLLTLLITTFIVHFKGDIFNSSAYLKGLLLLLLLTLYDFKKNAFA